MTTSERPMNNSRREEAESELKELMERLPRAVRYDNPFLFTRAGLIAKLAFYDEIIRKIANVPGDIVEVGAWYGQSSILLSNLRAIREPTNWNRIIYSFDTFSGYLESGGLDLPPSEIEKYKTTTEYVETLELIQRAHSSLQLVPQTFKNIVGDIGQTLPEFVPETGCVALVYFDVATYDTTKVTWDTMVGHMPKGSLFVFDDFGPQYEGVRRFASERGILSRYKTWSPAYYPGKLVVEI
jgi:hypothetical protein